MNLTRNRKRRLKIFVPIASMGDIAFLLIIFFMLTSNFMKESHIELKEASSPDIDSIKDSKISVSVDREGNVWLQGNQCDIGSLKVAVEALVQNTTEKSVMLKIDKDLEQKYFGPVFMELSKAGVEIALVGIQTSQYKTIK
jgi:biopolymer transport protein ExbD